VIEDVTPAARHLTEQYANNSIEADPGSLKSRLRPMRGPMTISSLRTVAAGHAFVQNLRRGHYAPSLDQRVHDRVHSVFAELAHCL
jgi:IS6 family transposase